MTKAKDPSVRWKTGWRLGVYWPVYLWVSPWTLVGVLLGLVGSRDRTVEWCDGVLGIYGPGVERWLKRAPIQGGAIAVTLGHTILACDERTMKESFSHEMVHVRQYQWFGPFFVPAYFLESGWQWLIGNDSYLDNRFEVQARRYS